MKSYDTIGSIAILKFPDREKISKKEKIKTALSLLKERNSLKTILEKSEKIKGRLRTLKTKYLAGEKTLVTTHKESSCLFKLNVEKCYFSPRLSNERLEVAGEISKNSSVLVLFAGVSPYSIVIAKLAKPKKVVSIELGKECCKYGKENVKLNKLNNVEILQGDVKKIVPKLKEKFDFIVMPRPNLKETFLKEAFQASKKSAKIFYNSFGKESDLGKMIEEIHKEAKKHKKKIKIIKVKKAGEIAPYKFRWRIDFKVL